MRSDSAGSGADTALPLAAEASRLGFDVVILCGAGTGEEALAAHNLAWRTYPLSRSGVNPL